MGSGSWQDARVDEATYRRTAARLGAADGTTGWQRLARLSDLWLRYAKVINLTGAEDLAGIRLQIVEGLAAVACAGRCEVSGVWLDVGAGGGFPGLVAAALGWETWLVEPREKRAGFLELALAEIGGVGHVVRHVLDVNTWEKKLRSGLGSRKKMEIAVASARAVWAPGEWAELGAEIVGSAGIFLVHTRPDVEVDARWECLARVDEAGWSVRAYRGGGGRLPLEG